MVYILNKEKLHKEITVKNIRQIIFENCYKLIGFTKEDSYITC